MKILVLTSTLPRFAGDMQANFVGEQAGAWRAARPGDEIVILAPHHAGAARSEAIDGVGIERFRYLLPESWQRLAYPAIMPNIRRSPALALQVPFFLLGQYRAAKRLARRMKPDLVYAHWVMPQGLVAWRLKRRFGIPYVLQNHSSDLSVFLKLGSSGRWLARTILRGADHFFCVNAAQKAFTLELFDGPEREQFARRITVLPMGISGIADLDAGDARGFDIATIARLSKKKGLDYLIEAAESLAERGIRPRIGIAGDGEDRAALEAMVRNADVTFPGFLQGAEKQAFLAEAQRFVFPSRIADGDVEGLPVALLEALCRGKPVLASRDTNIELLPEWPEIRDAVVFVEDPADIPALAAGLDRLLQSDPARARAVAGIMERYRWDRLIAEYLVAIEAAASAA
jgi:glycosyltransferase involved in cell wall biosynthesis